MIEISEKNKNDLDKLINIGKKYREGTISQSLFYDIVNTFQHDNRDKNDYINEYKKYIEDSGILIISGEDDVESQDEDNEDTQKIHPFDTSKVDISPKPLSLDMILARLENEEIDLFPDFQRKADLWSDKQQSQLIESLLLRIPLPAFYFDGSENDKWIVIDGLQRLTALKKFFVDKSLPLSGLEFLKDLESTTIDDMPRAYVRRMKETQITAYIINPGAPVSLKYNIFKRINTGGLKLEPQEIKHALFQGRAAKFLKKLADKQEFKEATSYSVKSDRMLDREFALRFIAFYELSYSKYRGSIDIFLNEAMEFINREYDEDYEKKMEGIFINVLNTCNSIFGKYAFRRVPDLEKRRPISKALFETWTSILAKYPQKDLQLLAGKKEYIFDEYIKLCKYNTEFIDAIGSGKIVSVRKRNEIIEEFIRSVLE